jgi:hypothetical protein
VSACGVVRRAQRGLAKAGSAPSRPGGTHCCALNCFMTSRNWSYTPLLSLNVCFTVLRAQSDTGAHQGGFSHCQTAYERGRSSLSRNHTRGPCCHARRVA